jgi:phosphatidate cytidylyltransferase
MKSRIITSLIAIPPIVISVWVGGYLYLFAMISIAGVGAYETSKMTRLRGIPSHPKMSFLVAIITVFLSFILTESDNLTYSYSFVLISTAAISVVWLTINKPTDSTFLNTMVGTICPAFYVGGFMGFAILLRELPYGMEWVFILLIATWSTDTSALIIGKAIGKTPFFPYLSPKKTLEGAWAGLISGIFASLISYMVFNAIGLRLFKSIWGFDEFGYLTALLLGIILGISSQMGDLFESLIKRRAGVKDSSKLMGPHGGVLDRIDSIVFNLFVLYYFIQWMGN